jgi:hypothetical protein
MSTAQTERSRKLLAHSTKDADGWDRCEGLNKTEAERLLDWLEVQGYAQREVVYVEAQGFTVRWRKEAMT